MTRKIVARDMIEQTKSISKGIDSLTETLEELSKTQNNADPKQKQLEINQGIKFKAQLRDLQQEFSQLKKLFKTQCKAMQLFDGAGNTQSAASKSGGVKNRRLQQVSKESDGLDKTLELTESIISQANASAESLQNQT